MLATAAIAFVVALATLGILLSRFGRLALDRPNERSLHARPVPRTGGIGVLCGTAVAFGFSVGELWLPMMIGMFLSAISFADDVRGMPMALRLALHVAAASVLVWYLVGPMHWAILACAVLALTWITNLYNFMDGSDGLAGGMTVIGFGAYAIVSDGALALLSTAIAAAGAAFLIVNFHPARIFMGDVGSIPLGFLAGGLGLLGWRNDVWPIWFPLLVFAPFVCDATLTLLKRLIRRERVWRAHRDHYYQRLVRMGLGHRKTACIEYSIMAGCAATAIYVHAREPEFQLVVVGGAAAFLLAIAAWVDLEWARHVRQSEPHP